MSDIVSSISVDDTSPNITYAGTTWTRVANAELYKNLYDDTETYTGVLGATATLNFYGTAMEYWGNSWNDHGPCAISLDNTFIGTITAYTSAPSGGPPTILYSTNNLALGDHTFAIQVTGTTAGATNCEIDRFVVNVTATEPTSTTTTFAPPSTFPSFTFSATTTPTKSATSKSSTPIGAIVGGVVGGIVFLVLLAILLCLCFRRRNDRHDQNRNLHPNVLASPPMSQMGMYYPNPNPNPNSYLNYVPPPPDVGYNPYSAYPQGPLPMSVSPTAPTIDTNTITNTATGSSPPPDKAEHRRSDVLSFTSASTSARPPTAPAAVAPGVAESTQDPPSYEKSGMYN